MAKSVELTIDEIGARGDGIAESDGKRIFVPFTLPGERVRARLRSGNEPLRAELEEIIAPAPGRVAPPCPHFGECGGCALQHMAPDDYAIWKREMVRTALARHGRSDVPIDDIVRAQPGQRRRAAFKAMRVAAGVILGFNARASHRIVDIGDECPILHPALAGLLPELKAVLAATLKQNRKLGVSATVTESGLDLVVVADHEPARSDHARLASFAEAQDIVRIAWQPPGEEPEPVIQSGTVAHHFAGVPVPLPPGAFLQPTQDGETALAAFVTAATSNAGRVADLYAGCGTFTFPLAAAARVRAVEGAAPLAEAIRHAADNHGLAGQVEAEARDLAQWPLMPEELSDFDAVVFDPPRAGARAQCEALAQSAVPTVVAVSCNPATFARDARILADGGYVLERVQPVDQFLWSPHVELAALFRRAPRS